MVNIDTMWGFIRNLNKEGNAERLEKRRTPNSMEKKNYGGKEEEEEEIVRNSKQTTRLFIRLSQRWNGVNSALMCEQDLECNARTYYCVYDSRISSSRANHLQRSS